MKIAIKEANETLYWLLVCERSESYPGNSELKIKVEELIRIISKILLSTKGRFGTSIVLIGCYLVFLIQTVLRFNWK